MIKLRKEFAGGGGGGGAGGGGVKGSEVRFFKVCGSCCMLTCKF